MTAAGDKRLGWRLRWAGAGAVIGMLLIGAAWGLTAVIKSPQEVLADAEPPPPSLITYPVENRVLQPRVAIPGVVIGPRQVEGTVPIEHRTDLERLTRTEVLVEGSPVRGSAPGPAGADGTIRIELDRRVEVSEGTEVEIRFYLDVPTSSELVVPISAVFTDSDGERVVVVLREGQQDQVGVRMGATVGGFVAISLLDSGTLAEGDEVLVSEPE